MLKPTSSRAVLAWARAAFFCLLFGWGISGALELDTARLEQVAASRYGSKGAHAVAAWLQLLQDDSALDEPDKLTSVNRFWNRRLLQAEDQTIWGQADYWATPLEALGKGAGDCEDFAIAKYFVLAESGCPCGCVRLLYARHHPADRAAASGAHMVTLAHTPFDDPWVLDSIDPLLVPLSKRDDLEPVFSFDHTSVWVGASEQGWHAGSDRIRPWAMLLARDRQQH